MGALIYLFLQNIQFIITAIVTYLLGCFNGAVIVSKYILRNDVRNHGSGNAGLTNFYRVFGGPLTVVVILTDVVKAVVALSVGVWLSGYYTIGIGIDAITPDPVLIATVFRYWAGFFCLLGHMFPCMFHFKGGKGILSGGTIAIMIDWRLALLVWGGWLILVVVTRYVSLGSVFTGMFFPVGTWLFVSKMPSILVLSVVIGGLIVFMHRGNLVRLAQGTENKFSLRKKKNPEVSP